MKVQLKRVRSSSGVGTRAVQFGKGASIHISEVSEDTDEDDDTTGETEKPDLVLESWNERMRHQQRIRDEAAKIQNCLDPLLSKLFVVIIDRCLESIIIIREMHGMPHVHVNLEYTPLTEKYENIEYELNTTSLSDLPHLDYQKLRRDISWIEKVLAVTINNLRKTWNYDHLLRVLNDYKVMHDEEKILLDAKKFNQTEILKLRQFQEAERDTLVGNIQKVTEELGNLKDELNDSLAEYDVKMRFLKQWEASRYEQNSMILNNKETSYSAHTKKMAVEINREERVHEEILMFLEESLKDNQQGIEEWMDKYDAEIDQFDLSINQRKIDLEMQKENYQILLEKYEDRIQKMEDYKVERLQKQKEAEELERRVQAATKLQSWWRGIMFRKGLGPWRRKKGKGKKGSAKNSGGKKNKKQ